MIQIRNARPDDAEFIARGFLMAVWMSAAEAEAMLPTCCRLVLMDDSLYSWRHARIAEYDGERAAVCIAYDGAHYRRQAAATFAYVLEQGGDDFTHMDQEAAPGEWYIDTLAVWPAFRRKGLARALLSDAIAQGSACPGIRHITLAVDPDHPWVVELYRSMGFGEDGTMFIFGQNYTKMAQPARR